MRTLLLGLIAGAAGKAALDVTTYGDMLLRDRPASNVPAKVVDEALAGLSDPSAEPNTMGLMMRKTRPRGRARRTVGLRGSPRLGRRVRAATERRAGLGGGSPASVERRAVGGGHGAERCPRIATGDTTDPRVWQASAWLRRDPHAVYGSRRSLPSSLLWQERESSPSDR